MGRAPRGLEPCPESHLSVCLPFPAGAWQAIIDAMIKADGAAAIQKNGHPMKNAWIVLAATCTLVIGVYVATAHSGYFTSTSLNASGQYYNLLVQGFRDGQLNLKTDVPPGFARLADP